MAWCELDQSGGLAKLVLAPHAAYFELKKLMSLLFCMLEAQGKDVSIFGYSLLRSLSCVYRQLCLINVSPGGVSSGFSHLRCLFVCLHFFFFFFPLRILVRLYHQSAQQPHVKLITSLKAHTATLQGVGGQGFSMGTGMGTQFSPYYLKINTS